MDEDFSNQYLSALVELHRGLPRQGPGDRQFTLNLLGKLPILPNKPRIADLGCGSGVAALLLADYYQGHVKAVDTSEVFIEDLRNRLANTHLEPFVEPLCADMASLDWAMGSIDLLWSEGAAYMLGFKSALQTWRPLLAVKGVAVISEMSWFADDVPGPARDFWQSEYPAMATETQNLALAKEAGFAHVFTERLPSNAWWENYYYPLQERMDTVARTEMMQRLIRDTEKEMSLFERYSDFYGYTFYVLTTPAKQ